MGLDTTHGAWSGAYSSFNRFREELAKAIGFNLKEFEGFGGSRSFDEIDNGIRWLLDHSDCDGDIAPDKCKLIADAIWDILPDLDDTGPFSVRESAERFMRGCIKAYRNDENLESH